MITSPATVVNIATGGGTDTVNIGTSVGPASTLFATFNITNPDQSGDILVVDDSASFLTGTISITSTQIQFSNASTTTVTRSGSAFNGGLNLKTGMVADTVNLNSVSTAPAVEPHTITLTDGDIFNVGAAGGSLDTFPQTITATAAAASTAIVNIDDSGDTTSNTY